MRRLDRVPLRWRVTATFVLAAAVVLGILAVFLHAQLLDELDDSIDAALARRLRDVSSLVRADPTSALAPDTQPADERRGPEDVTQLLSQSGTVIASEGTGDTPLLSGTALANGRRTTVRRDHDRLALLTGRVGSRTVIVGADLQQRDRAISELDGLLLVGMPVALLLAGLAGAWASRVALAPVDRMRERADTLGLAELDERLPEPVANDELQRLARTLNTMIDRLRDGYLRERQFVDDAAHELRTPLSTLRAELELSTARPRGPDELEATVRSAQTQTERLVALANDLLVLARGAHGALPLRTEPLAVHELLRSAAERAGTDAIEVGPSARGAGIIVADRLRIEQALDNLVANAREHGRPPIVVDATTDGATTTITVDDGGPPIDPALARRAFERFTRGDSARSGTGTGLGLAIVEAIVTAHAGQAGLEASPTGGTRAWLRLPH